jgi:hypothetical protein
MREDTMLTYDYIHDFPASATVCIPGTTHRLQTAALHVDVKVPDRHGRLIPYFLGWWHQIDPASYDVQVHLMTNRHGGIILLTRAEQPCT